MASRTHVIFRDIRVYRAKLERYITVAKDDDDEDELTQMSPRSPETPRTSTPSRAWAKWFGVDIGYQTDKGKFFVKANINMIFRGSVYVPLTESGKTSLFRTFCGSLPTLSGDAGDTERRHLLTGSCITIVEGGLLSNVSYPESDTDEARAVSCLHWASLFEDKGIEWLRQRGSSLSSTECQKLALARAFYSQPSVVFMDNALSLLSDDEVRSVYQHFREMVDAVVSCGPERQRCYHDYTYSIAHNKLEAIPDDEKR